MSDGGGVFKTKKMKLAILAKDFCQRGVDADIANIGKTLSADIANIGKVILSDIKILRYADISDNVNIGKILLMY